MVDKSETIRQEPEQEINAEQPELILETQGPKIPTSEGIEEKLKEDEIDKRLVSEIGIINNRPKGKETERPVFPELDKDTLTYVDVKKYVLADRQELSEISKEMENILEMPISSKQAQELVAKRMEDLMIAASNAIFVEQKKKEEEVWVLINEQRRLKDKNSSLWRNFFPNHEELQKIEQLKKEIKALHNSMRDSEFTSGKKYTVERQTEGRMLLRGNVDVLLVYNDDQGEKRGLRLNLIQLNLARRGIFYKGEPTDNRYDGHPGWEQAAYPQSPLKFYQDHMADWLQDSPEEAKKILSGTEEKRVEKKIK